MLSYKYFSLFIISISSRKRMPSSKDKIDLECQGNISARQIRWPGIVLTKSEKIRAMPGAIREKGLLMVFLPGKWFLVVDFFAEIVWHRSPARITFAPRG
jgi:hypothetical protein